MCFLLLQFLRFFRSTIFSSRCHLNYLDQSNANKICHLPVFTSTTIQMMMIIDINKIGAACGQVEWFDDDDDDDDDIYIL